MTRVARVAFVVLVGATFAAFFVAQRLKSAPPVIRVSGLAVLFSPNGDSRNDVNRFTLTMAKAADDVAVDVIDAAGDRVRRIAQGRDIRPGMPLRLRWDGRRDDGRRAPDGRYRLRVTFRGQGRAAIVPGLTVVDTHPPHSTVCVGVRCTDPHTANIVAPGTGRVRVYLKGVSRKYPTDVRVLRTDDAPPHEVAHFSVPAGTHRLLWDGKVAGAPAPPGIYLFQVRVRDRAGNVAVTPAHLRPGEIGGRPGLTIRALAAQPPLMPVTAGGKVEVFVDARGHGYRWSVRRIGYPQIRRHGVARDPHLSFTAPKGNSGAYLLTLRSGTHTTRVPFLVQSTERARILVVVPAITWLGTDRIDDPPFDGLPNTLSDGGTVHWPRVFGGGGLPEGFAADVAPLLVFLDRHGVRYDLTSDLDLALSRNPRASDRDGVLLAGSERWVTRPLARRLRRYVSDGGRLAYFGTDTLRRGVAVTQRGDAGTLTRPTQPTATDPFGAHLERLRTIPAPEDVILIDGQDPLGLMTGTLGLSGFSSFEESTADLPAHAKLLAGVGEPLTDAETAAAESSGKAARELRPALTAVQIGKGVAIRVGLPQWAQKLRDRDVAQVTSNIADVLRGVKPRIRSR